MPYVPPIVGFFGRALDANGNIGGLRLWCSTCADGLKLSPEHTTPIFADLAELGSPSDRCDFCRLPLTDDLRQTVHVGWGTKPEDVPIVYRPIMH